MPGLRWRLLRALLLRRARLTRPASRLSSMPIAARYSRSSDRSPDIYNIDGDFPEAQLRATRKQVCILIAKDDLVHEP